MYIVLLYTVCMLLRYIPLLSCNSNSIPWPQGLVSGSRQRRSHNRRVHGPCTWGRWRSHAESRNVVIPHGHDAHCLLMWKRIADDVDARDAILLLLLSDRRWTTGTRTPDDRRCRSVKDAFTYTTFWSVAVNYAKGSCSSSDWIFHGHFRSLIVWMTGPCIPLLLYNRLY